MKKIWKKTIIIIFLFCFLLFASNTFANTKINTTLGIKQAPTTIIFSPPSKSGTTNKDVYAQVIWTGVRANNFICTGNHTYIFYYYRGTGPFDSWAAFSSGNTRTKLHVTGIVNWIDKSWGWWDDSWWWGWWWSDPCSTRSCNSTYYNSLCWPCATAETWVMLSGGIPTQEDTPKAEPIISEEETAEYSKEMLDAYKYAYMLWITTKWTPDEASLDWPIIRKQLAKMISEYAIKIVGIKPDNNKKCNFTDIENESEEMKYYMRLSCKLGLMGLKADGIAIRPTFMPNEFVNRAQFWTVFSRLIFGLEYNLKTDELTFFDQTMNALQKTTQNIANLFGIRYVANIQIDRYTKHLVALKKNEVMKNIDPIMTEIRWYVMMMMMRADKNWVIQAHSAAKIHK